MSTAYFLNDKEMDTKERRFEILNEFFHPVKIVDVKFPLDMDTTFKVRSGFEFIRVILHLLFLLGENVYSVNCKTV